MNKVTRYTCGNGEGMFDDKEGHWIEYEEYKKVVDELNEIKNYGVSHHFRISPLIDNHQMCIEILEGIKHFEQRKKHKIESIDGFAGTFPELRREYVNDIDTINRCIKRLEQRYKRVLNGR